MTKNPLTISCNYRFYITSSLSFSANPLVENKPNPTGIDVKAPRFNWQLISAKRNLMQTAYESRVSENPPNLLKNKNIIWSPGKVLPDSSVHVSYKGNELQLNKRYHWQGPHLG